jgi:hypothetical protein
MPPNVHKKFKCPLREVGPNSKLTSSKVAPYFLSNISRMVLIFSMSSEGHCNGKEIYIQVKFQQVATTCG